MSERPGLIAVDWGSSRFRAFLLSENGALLDQVESDQGIFAQEQGGHEKTLHRSCGRWLEREDRIPILMAGMIGSRDGWFETSYLPCPVGIHGLGENIVQAPSIDLHPVYIVPGITDISSSGLPDILRGEETQIFGIFNQPVNNPVMTCLPGTHSKWVKLENNQIVRFSTYMTGEVFAAVHHCGSISSVLDDCEFDENTFLEGVEVSQGAGGLLHHLFSIRSRAVSGQNRVKSTTSYLSGLLIGEEIRSAREFYPELTDIVVIGADSLVRDYAWALSSLGISVVTKTSGEASLNGLWNLASVSEKVRLKKETLRV